MCSQYIKRRKKLANGAKEIDVAINLTLINIHNYRSITWHIPVVMGDTTTEDCWYPYVFLKTNDDSKVTSKQKRTIKSQRPGTLESSWLVHAGDLDEGDEIYFTPSTFDFEYLDSTARRFEIHYDEETGRRPHPTRPFYLEDLDRFQILWDILQDLQYSQRHQVIYTIEATREMWHGEEQEKSWIDPVFKQFVTDTLANAAWQNKQWQDIPERQQLVDAGIRGELADLADLHMRILKEQ